MRSHLSSPPRRVRPALAGLVLVAALSGCGSHDRKGQASAGATPTASKTAAKTTTSSNGGKATVKLLARDVTPGRTPGKPQTQVQVKGTATVQFLAYPRNAAPGDTLQIRIPDVSGGQSRATARLVRGGQVTARSHARFTTSSTTAQIKLARYVCLVPPSPTYCPVDARHSNGAYQLRTAHLKQMGPLVIVLTLGRRRG